jgi:hypothetical protein
MDREATVIRAEMSETRAELDRKITRLEARAKQMTPRRLTERYMPDYFVDRAIGGVLTLIGLRLAWSLFRKRNRHRERIKTIASAYARW